MALAAALHDIGMSIHRSGHEQYSLILAAPKVRQLLADVYEEPERTIMTSEILHGSSAIAPTCAALPSRLAASR